MKNKEIMHRLERAVNEAPIDLYQAIQNAPCAKMEKHDSITEQKKKRTHPVFLKPLTIGVSFALILVAGLTGWYHFFLSPDSYIYFDLNPGIEIVTNRQDQVIRLVGINEAGKDLVKSIEYRRVEIDQVQDRILDKIIEEGILKDTRRVMLVSAFNKDQKKSEEIIRKFDQRIHDYLENENIQLVVLRQVIEKNNTLVKFSETYHITMGKMTFIRNLMILNPNFRLENLVILSLEELLLLSLQTGLELDRIIESDDDYKEVRLPDVNVELEHKPQPDLQPEPEPQPDLQSEPEPHPSLSPARLSMDEAKIIALRKTGGGTVVKFEFDSDDREYTFTIHYNGYEYEIEMDAYTGRIKDIDTDELDDEDIIDGDQSTNDLIGLDRAREIAIGRVGGGSVGDIELDEEDDLLIYEVEVEYDGKEYELEIDAYTGEILFFEIND